MDNEALADLQALIAEGAKRVVPDPTYSVFYGGPMSNRRHSGPGLSKAGAERNAKILRAAGYVARVAEDGS